MSFGGTLNIGRSGLAANQAALQVAGNNLANSANVGYTRQSSDLNAATSVQLKPGLGFGTGVELDRIIRHVDAALMSRLRTSIAEQESSAARHELLSQIEAVQNNLSDAGLNDRLSAFFNVFSELANNPTDGSLRTLAVQEGVSLTEYMRSLHEDMTNVRRQNDDAIRDTVNHANSLLDEVATLNAKITVQEGGAGGANGLRDERDQIISELAGYIDLTVNEQDTGAVDVLVKGIPIVLGGTNRGLEADFNKLDANGDQQVRLRVRSDGTFLEPRAGRIGSLIETRADDVLPAINALEDFGAALIYQVNRVHSQGQGATLFDEATGTYGVTDPALSLTNSDAGLAFVPGHGTFQVHVTQRATGTRQSSLINVDLDGIGGPDMSLNDLAAAIDAVANISASVTVDGKLSIAADSPDFQFSFSDDTSGALASLGVNTYFEGETAFDIDVSGVLKADATKLAVTRDHVVGGNANALLIGALQDTDLADLGGISLITMWTQHIEDYAVRTAQGELNLEADQAVVDSLNAQRESVSGVSVDEEAINLLTYQRGYQASARFINVVSDMLDTLIAIVN